MRTWQKRLMVLASGGLTLGVAGSFQYLNFGSILVAFLTSLFSLLAQLIFGGTIPTTTTA
jgi:hypothetical protein